MARKLLFKYYPVELVLISPFFTLYRMVLQLYGALTGRGASGRFSAEQSIFSGVLVLIKAWTAAFGSLFRILKQRREFASRRRIGRRELYRLFCMYRLSASQLALKE